MQTFATSVGMASAGWVGPSGATGGFPAFISFRTAANIFRIRVSGLPSAETAERAVLKAAAMM